MAEILIKAVNRTHEDSGKDKRGCYKRGDPVVVMPDGHVWGALELKPPATGGKFVVLKIPGVSVAATKKYIDREVSVVDENVILTRRLWRIVVDELPSGVRNTLNTTGEYTVTWNTIRHYIENKVTFGREDNVGA